MFLVSLCCLRELIVVEAAAAAIVIITPSVCYSGYDQLVSGLLATSYLFKTDIKKFLENNGSLLILPNSHDRYKKNSWKIMGSLFTLPNSHLLFNLKQYFLTYNVTVQEPTSY